MLFYSRRMKPGMPATGQEGKVRLFFLARSLDSGGTERQLVTLAKALDKRLFDVTVCLFYGQGELLAELENAPGVTLALLDKKGRWDALGFLARLVFLLMRAKPHVVYAMLPVPNIIGLACARAGCKAKVVWGLRASRREIPKGDFLPGAAYFLETCLSRFSNLVIANSRAGKQDAVARGFPPHKITVIENGIDTEKFRFDEQGRARMRQAWGILPGERLVGLVANVRPVKGHPDFIEAAARVARNRPDCRFVCIGDGPVDELQSQAKTLGLEGKIAWAGLCRDMPAAYSALDLLCSASQAEGFSNVIAEAMSCGVPCVATDVGDSAHILGKTGLTAPPGDAPALAKAMKAMLARVDKEPDAGLKARERIEKHFSTRALASRTREAILAVLLNRASES